MDPCRIIFTFLILAILAISAAIVQNDKESIPIVSSTLASNGTLVPNKNGQVINRLRRDCACTTTTGRCMPYGSYQCWFQNGASVVQCVHGGKWTLLAKCDGTCQSLGNDRPYCL